MKKTTVAAITTAFCTTVLSSCGMVNVNTNPAAPEKLKVPDGQKLSLESPATGVQIYECKLNQANLGRWEWVLKAPEADLFDSTGKKIGKHYGGPTWESNDGSKVVGEVKAKEDSPDSTAIPLLLLSAKSTSGTGVFSNVQSIHRLQTAGGKAPAAGCDKTQANKELRVPYKATYYFYVAKS